MIFTEPIIRRRMMDAIRLGPLWKFGMVLLAVLACPTVWKAKTWQSAQAKKAPWAALDRTLKSCAEFVDANSHLDFEDDYFVVRSKSTIEGPSLEAQADQKEIDTFMIWYELTGHYELFRSGQECMDETQEKYNEAKALKAGMYIHWEERVKSDFFAQELLKRFTGRSIL